MERHRSVKAKRILTNRKRNHTAWLIILYSYSFQDYGFDRGIKTYISQWNRIKNPDIDTVYSTDF